MGSNPCPQAGSTLKAVKRKFLGRYRVQAAFDGDLYVFPVVGKSCIPAFGPQGYFTVHHPSGKIAAENRSEEHTSELQSLMRISYAVFCLKKKKNTQIIKDTPE